MAGHWYEDGTQMAEAIRRVMARQGVRASLKRFPWWLVRLTSPFVPTLRELMEMRYLWQVRVQMSNAQLQTVLGEEPHTPLDSAVEATLVGIGCLR